MVAIMNKYNLHYQKVVILPVLVTTHLPYTFILPCFYLENIVNPPKKNKKLEDYFIGINQTLIGGRLRMK